jgi:pimeloyl-ACP methyl ester carboxylesterase
VSPAGGIHSRPLLRAIGQLMADSTREPPSMATVAVPDYMSFGLVGSLRLFLAMTRFPALESLVHQSVPVLAVLGTRDPLLPPARRIRQVAEQIGDNVTVAVIKDAAHAINYSHPVELAALIRSFATGDPLVETAERLTRDAGLADVAIMDRRGGG